MILVVSSDGIIDKCLKRILQKNGFFAQISSNVIEAINLISNAEMPNLIFLDIMLTGPDGFTLLNELASYPDTMKIPVALMGEKDFSGFDFSVYNVVGFLNKNTMKPEEVVNYARQFA